MNVLSEIWPLLIPFFIFGGLILFFFTCVAVIIIIFISYHKPGKKIISATKNLQHDLTNESVSEFISLITNAKRIPNHPVYWNTCRAAYSLISSSENIDRHLKENLKKALLSKGVTGL
ncbi:hypothetical protein KS419_07835 [Bacillus tamaricis]|uniref:ATP synthase F0 subunit 8 n=1 Tax=Evansella tamaricis TaxID=2069301 RepID=A0ABS6JD95_9BACI|nr:hypothetical protein [Evansella tamaricis]MBU9711642.1 hypothetical protein [Evansella tamaricis]